MARSDAGLSFFGAAVTALKVGCRARWLTTNFAHCGCTRRNTVRRQADRTPLESRLFPASSSMPPSTPKGLASRLLNSGLDSLFSGGGLFSLFGGGGGLGKNYFPPAPGGGFPFYDGGYTGDGGKYQPAGVVHKGEYVFDKAAVKAAGGPAALEAMRRNLKGYANGGAVGVSVPSVPSLKSLGGNSQAPVSVSYAPVIDARGADAEAVARLEKVVAKQAAELQGRIEAGVRSAQKRNVKLG